jgi:outer membrane murein-binding lipoprotein Lpp
VNLPICFLAQRSFRFGAIALAVLLMASGCTAMAKVTNLSDDSCRASLTRQLSSILTAEGEHSTAADALATKTVSTLSTYDLGPRPFAIAAPSGTDYRLFARRTQSACLLTLPGRRKGFVSYTNNLTYIATQPLPGCTCVE